MLSTHKIDMSHQEMTRLLDKLEEMWEGCEWLLGYLWVAYTVHKPYELFCYRFEVAGVQGTACMHDAAVALHGTAGWLVALCGEKSNGC